ncbi:hypothetical protein ARMSODRAFT_620962 [Armillaria solidipes]|uniref:Uncharacterized protein n=1 Tax=Armillaria solidipes TaxID=1076256 RepID=A0A2H3B421_9AGAR|nr:hypothetical protein ARMSODRAFT_620962 [Armillaria solidipes]
MNNAGYVLSTKFKATRILSRMSPQRTRCSNSPAHKGSSSLSFVTAWWTALVLRHGMTMLKKSNIASFKKPSFLICSLNLKKTYFDSFPFSRGVSTFRSVEELYRHDSTQIGVPSMAFVD